MPSCLQLPWRFPRRVHLRSRIGPSAPAGPAGAPKTGGVNAGIRNVISSVISSAAKIRNGAWIRSSAISA